MLYTCSMTLSEAEWDEQLKLARVTKVAKNLTKNFAHSRNKSIYLYPEECLCLIDMVIILFYSLKNLMIFVYLFNIYVLYILIFIFIFLKKL